jgi:hypothetical protein
MSAVNTEESTQVRLILVSGSNFNNRVITLDADNGTTDIGGQWTDGRLRLNNKDNATIVEINTAGTFAKFKDQSNTTRAVLDCESGDLYLAGRVHEGKSPAELDQLFS